jgi:murein DD-endopeptidase MepM/ murein hydrolase activator NlpD
MLPRVLMIIWLAPNLYSPSMAVDRLVQLTGDFMQGGMVRGMTQVGAKITLYGKSVRVSDDGKFVFGFGRDATGEATLEVELPGGETETRALKISAREYRVERIDGLPSKMVTPPPEVLKRIRRENKKIAQVRKLDTPETWYAATFQWPASGRISGVYGSQRILNGEARRPHFGVDVAAPVGTPVYAPAGGNVALAENDLYYTGGTVMINHGHGITSLFSHLSAVDAKVGTEVAAGDLIGRIGATGRATGAHLDWRVNWFGERLDPELLVGPMPDGP